MDFECLQPLDILHYSYDFYTGVQPLDTGLVHLGIGIIGSIPGHQILKTCIESIFHNYSKKMIQNNIPAKTGPTHFTKVFFSEAGTGSTIDVALPAHYFYPLGSVQVECKRAQWIKNGSFGIHHWAKTWNKPCYRRQQFRSIKSWGTLL